MRNLWLVVLLLFCAVASGFLLVRGRPADDPRALAETLVEEARGDVAEVAGELGLAEPPAERPEPGTFYRYTDASGAMRFVTSLAEVPASLRASARPVGKDRVQRAPTLAAGAPKPVKKPLRPDPIEVLEARASEHEVIVYTTSWCGWCRKTLAYLNQQGVPFENRDIEADEMWREELLDKTGSTSIPVVEIDGQIVRGYDPKRMAALLSSS